jgi:drug/metabolite transporter (DMT)-like permease
VALLLALGASLSWGAGDFLGGLASRRASVLTVLPLTQGAGLIGVAVVLAIAQDPVPGLGPAAVAAAAGLAGAVGLAGLYRGMAIGAMSVVAPISALAAVVPFTVGVARGERPSKLQLVGVVAALIGIVLVSREPGRGSSSPARAAGVGLALVAAAGFGFYFTFTDIAADDAGAPWTVFVSRGTATAVAIVTFLIARPPLRLERGLVRLVLAVGLFDVAANVLFGVATTKGLVSIVSVLASLYPVVTVVLARVVLHERISSPQRAGAGAALAGAALITAG